LKFTAECMLVAYASPDASASGRIAGLAHAAEEAGFDAIGFNDHPAPSTKWLQAGGHESFDPFAALAFCAAITSRIRLMPFLAVVPYRNPYLLAKSVATVDNLSDGRLVLCAGTGYLRSEFGALGVNFEQRNDDFDEALAVLRSVWTDQWDRPQVSRPGPVQLPHPPIWIGGNSALTRRRVAASAQGWSPMMAGETLSRTARTAVIGTADDLSVAIDDLKAKVEDNGRDPADIEIQVNGVLHRHDGVDDLATEPYLDAVRSLAAIGVTSVVVHLELDSSQRPEETIASFGSEIIPKLH
jgi:probable F420-dependent oxidoreductase